MKTLFQQKVKSRKAGFIAKNNITYEIDKPRFIDDKAMHYGYIQINEDLRNIGIRRQVVNFGFAGGYLFPY